MQRESDGNVGREGVGFTLDIASVNLVIKLGCCGDIKAKRIKKKEKRLERE